MSFLFKKPQKSEESQSKTFFESIGFPYPQINNQEYAISESVEFSSLGLNINQQKFDQISCELANLIDNSQQKIQTIKNWQIGYSYTQSLEKLDFKKQPPLACMRLGYVIDTEGVPKLIEVNSQTPSFWWECEDGSQAVLKKLRKEDTSNQYSDNLNSCLRYNLIECAKNLDKPVKNLNIGLITCDSQEDIFQMQFLKNKIESLKLVQNSEVLTIDRMDISRNGFDGSRVFSLNSGNFFDVIFLWYPLEWLLEEEFADGAPVKESLNQVLEEKNVVIFNGLASFVAQNKNLFAFMTEAQNWEEVETRNLDDYLTPSYYTREELEVDLGKVDWIAKPIWGRQGAGIFGKVGSGDIEGDLSDEYYNSQNYIYQPFHKLKPIVFQGRSYNFTLEKWVYKTDRGWQPGGHSLRLAEGAIVNDTSKWLTISSETIKSL